MNTKNRLAAALCMLVLPLAASAADIHVKMLTKGSDGQALVFEPSYVKVKVGDTVVYTPAEKAGHTSISLLVPPGAKTWKAKPDTEIRVKIEKQGIYLVECDVHKTLGMVSVVQAGKAVNLEEAKKVAAEESAKMAVGKDRYAKALAQVK
jgi:pseudoazurin